MEYLVQKTWRPDRKEANLTGRMPVRLLSEIEELAEEIMADKEQIKDLDHKRNTNREALTALKKCKDSESSKSWLCLGGMFIKYSTSNIFKVLQKDQEELESEIQRIRTGLKTKVSKLHELEGKQLPKGFNLRAMGKEELPTVTVQKH